MVILLLFIIPLSIAIIGFMFNRDTVTIKELGLHLFVSLLFSVITSVTIYYQNVADYEVIHGQVTDKKQVRVSCSHSYPCNCRTVRRGKTTTTRCSTCHRHTHDYDWRVYSTIGNINIDRVDSQGKNEPPRFTKVKIGEPASTTKYFENFIKGSPDSLFHNKALVEKYSKELPKNPVDIYDYYRSNRFISELYFTNTFITDLEEFNKINGPTNHSSMAIIIVVNKDREFYSALEEYYLGGKKNDIIPVISVDNEGNIQWIEIMSWTRDNVLNVKLRDSLLTLKNIKNSEKEFFKLASEDIKSYYVPKSMSDFEYLKNSIKPTQLQLTIAFILNLILSIGLFIYCKNNDVFNEEWKRRY